jgi:hypothetical protein
MTATTRTLASNALCVASITTDGDVEVSVSRHSTNTRRCAGYRVEYSRRSEGQTFGGVRRFATLGDAASFAADRFAAYTAVVS